MKKEKFIAEIETAFQIFELLKNHDWTSWHRIISTVEQLRNEQQKLHDVASKEAYMTGRPVGVKDSL